MCRSVMLHVTDKIQPNQSLPFKFSLNVAQNKQENYTQHISEPLNIFVTCLKFQFESSINYFMSGARPLLIVKIQFIV